HDPLDLVEAPERRARRGEERDADVARGLVALLDREIAPELALRRSLRLAGRPVAGEIEEVPGTDRRDVVRDRRVRGGERDVLGFESGFGAHRVMSPYRVSFGITCVPNISIDDITCSWPTVSVAIRNCSSSTPACSWMAM